jgi:localization factor PodJL
MTSGAPWSVKGIDPKAREVAKDLARRSGMTLGEWLNRMILEEDGPEDIASESYFTDPTYAAKTFVAERPARTYIETPRQEVFKAPEPPLRPEPLYVAPTRFEAPEHPGDEIARVTVALDRLTDRIENSEGRTGKAISGVEHSVREAVERIESAEREHVAIAARFEGAVEDTRTEQARLSDRLRRMESEAAGPRSAEALRALEQALGRVANHLYEGENRTRQTLADLRERVERAEAGAPAPSVEVIEEVVERVGARLTEAEARTSEALEGLRASFAGLDGRVRTVETEAPASLDQKLEHFAASLTATLTERVEATRGELAKSLETASEGRFDRMERKLSEMTDQVRAAEERSAQAIERVGREVLTVADNLNRRVQVSETRSADAIEHVGGEVARIAQTVETRLTRNDTIQAEAMEKLGAEIARISERLAERIANAERRSAQAFDDVGEQVARISERIGVHGDRASDELVERIRLSEERTARLLDEAREKIDQRLGETQRRIAEQVAAAPLVSAPTYADPVKAFGEPEPFPAFEADEPPAPRPAGQATMQTTGLTTRSGFATPRPMSAIAPQVVVPQAIAPQTIAPQTLAAQAAEAPAVFAPEPFPGAAQASTFDAEDFEAADGFADLSEATADTAFEGDLETEDFAPELELIEEVAEPSSSGFGASAFEALDAEEAEAEEHRSEAFDALDAAAPEDPKDETAAYGASAFDVAEDEEAHDDPAFARSAFAPLEEEDHAPKLPLSTREVIEQARAAARAAVENDNRGRWPKTSPKAKAEKAERAVPGASLFSSMFGGRAKRRAGSSLQTALVVMGTAALVSLGAAGFMLMDGRPGGAPPKRVSEALAALSGGRIKEVVASEQDTTPFPATPRVAMALSPQPIVPAGPGQPTAPDLSDRFGKAAQGVKAGAPGAIDELKAVAELGHAPAQFYLARLYEKGEGGLKVDLAASRRWTERAAEGGDPRAMHNVGMAYINGAGGPKNSTTAAQWFRRAADLGLVDSQFNLAALYEKGLGVSQNPAEAYKWYLIAAKTGDGDARQRADQVRGQLTPDARAVAEQAATAFRPAIRNPSAAPVATAALGGDNAGVIVAQRALSRLGYYLGPTDGSASPALQLAIAAYQRDHNTPVTGILDQPTLQGLSVYTR